MRSRAGAALVESLVAIAIMGAVVMMIFQSVLSSERQAAAFRDRDRAMAAARTVAEALKNYVTADASEATRDAAPGGAWRLPGDPCAHALQADCAHEASSLLPAGLRSAGFTAAYTVAPSQGGGLAVRIHVRWPEAR